MFSDSLYFHAFNLLPEFGPNRLIRLSQYFTTNQEAFSASGKELVHAGIEQEMAERFLSSRAGISLEHEQEKLEKLGIKLLDFRDKNYPKLLLEISKFPPLLYYRGQMREPEELCVAIVGTRKMTNYGRVVTPFLIEPLVRAGITTVSGLAFGVDSAVQKISADNGKRTVAVLGCGIDEKSIYPKEHVFLADSILANGGAIISEYPPGTPPLKHHFIARNRIISGMSVATIIIECNLKSGSLITAKYALEQNRTVYAVPGPIYAEESKGPNNLIKMGAKLITGVEDILNDLNLKTLPEDLQTQSAFGDSPAESAILKILSLEPVGINELIKTVGLDAGDVTSALTFLEMKGKVRNLGGQQYVLSR